MCLGLSFMESSLDSPEFPFLGGAFGTTAWLCMPKERVWLMPWCFISLNAHLTLCYLLGACLSGKA